MFLDGAKTAAKSAKSVSSTSTSSSSSSNNNNNNNNNEEYFPLRELFGHSVATDCLGRVLVIGAPLASTKTLTSPESSDSFLSSAAAGSGATGKVYVVDGKTGKILRTLQPPTDSVNTANDGSHLFFGTSVDISCGGSYIAVGAPSPKSVPRALQNSTSTPEISAGGMVYLYKRKGAMLYQTFRNPKFNTLKPNKKQEKRLRKKLENWFQPNKSNETTTATTIEETKSAAKMMNSALNKNSDYFGLSVSLMKEFVLIGAPAHETQLATTSNTDHDMADNRGCIHMFGTGGALFQTITPPKTTLLENSIYSFGTSLAMNQRGQILVGAPKHDTVWLYAPGVGDILQTYTLPDKKDGTSTSYFGQQVSMSRGGNTIVISAPGNVATAGRVYIYDGKFLSNTSPIQSVSSPIGEQQRMGDDFGYSVALDANGNTLIVGAPNHDTYKEDDGIAHIFNIVRKTADDETTSTIVKLAKTVSTQRSKRKGNFGQSVAIDKKGEKVVIGSHENLDSLLPIITTSDTVNDTTTTYGQRRQKKHHDEVAVFCFDTEGRSKKWTPCSDYYSGGGFPFLTLFLFLGLFVMIYKYVLKSRFKHGTTYQLLQQGRKTVYEKLGYKHHGLVNRDEYYAHDLQFTSMVDPHHQQQQQPSQQLQPSPNVELSDYYNNSTGMSNTSSSYASPAYTPASLSMIDSTSSVPSDGSSSMYSNP